LQMTSAAHKAVPRGALVQPAYPSFQEGSQDSENEVPAHHDIVHPFSQQVLSKAALVFVKWPLELRVQVMWGRVYMITFFPRGPRSDEKTDNYALYMTPTESDIAASKWTCRYPSYPRDQVQELFE